MRVYVGVWVCESVWVGVGVCACESLWLHVHVLLITSTIRCTSCNLVVCNSIKQNALHVCFHHHHHHHHLSSLPSLTIKHPSSLIIHPPYHTHPHPGNLPGDVLLAAVFVCYAGPFNAEFRETLLTQRWIPDLLERGIPTTPGVQPLDMLTTNAEKVRRESWCAGMHGAQWGIVRVLRLV